MKITRLKVTNYRGVASVEVTVPPTGGVLKGPNAAGKTSILRAISAALAAQGCGPEDIRLGEDSAEILVDIDALRVRRAITKKGTTVTVSTAEGARFPKPQSYLNELLGTAAIDPLGFFLADAKERRRQVLEVLPCAVTAEDIARWAPGAPTDIDTSGHGLEVLERVRGSFYDLRTSANRAAKEAADTAALKRAEAGKQAAGLSPEAVELASAGAAAVRRTLADAERLLKDAEQAARNLRAKDAAAAAAAKSTAVARTRAAGLRQQAEEQRGRAGVGPASEHLSAAKERCEGAAAVLVMLRKQLVEAEAAARESDEDFAALERAHREAEAAGTKASELDVSAEAIESSIAGVEAMGVSAEELETADAEVLRGGEVLAVAKGADRLVAYQADAEAAERAATEAAATAAELDVIVKTLTDVAPRELADRSAGIPGLVVGEDGIALDGKAIDQLSGAEQLELAVEIARRANARSRILVVDGLERLDGKRMEAFVRAATAGGYQLLATRVADGDLVLEALEVDDAPAEAAE